MELSATGGTLEQFDGTTDANGVFETEAEVDEDATEMTVDVIVRAAAGGPPLAEETVSATNVTNPPGVFLRHRFAGLLSGIGFSYYEVTSTGRREVRLWSDVLFENIDHLGPFDQEYDQARTGSHAGATADTRSRFTQRSEVHLDAASGEFRGFDFEGTGDVFLELANPGTEVQFFTFADGVSSMCVSFAVRGHPVGFAFSASSGPTGELGESYIDVDFEGRTDDGTEVVIVDLDEPGPANASGMLRPGSYDVCLELLLSNRIDVNQPHAADYFALEPRQLTLTASLTITP